MISFKEFLAEQFFKGTGTPFGYAEIYRDPTADEILSMTNGSSFKQLGGILTNGTLYVWDRDVAQHMEVRFQVPVGAQWIPLYMYYDQKTRTMTVELAEWSMTNTYPGYLSPAGIASISHQILSCPALKKLGAIKLRKWTR
jgi:hypothetical protein